MQSWVAGATTARRFTLYDENGDPRDLSGGTPALALLDRDGNALVTAGDVAVVSASDGTVDYTPDAANHTTALGPLRALFTVTGGTNPGTYPPDGPETWLVYPAGSPRPELTFGQMRRQVMRWLDTELDYDEGNNIDLLVRDQLNTAAAARAAAFPWSFLRSDTTVASDGQTRIFQLPGDMQRLLYVWSPTDRRHLTKVPERHLLDKNLVLNGGAATSGLYGAYQLIGTQLVLEEPWPLSENLVIGYYRMPSVMRNARDLPDLPFPHGQLLVWDALLDLKSYAKEAEFISIWAAKQAAADANLFAAFSEGQTLGEIPQTIHPPDLS